MMRQRLNARHVTKRLHGQDRRGFSTVLLH